MLYTFEQQGMADIYLCLWAFVASLGLSVLIYSYRRSHDPIDRLYTLRLPVFDSRDDDNGIVATLEKAHNLYPSSPFVLAVPGQQLVVLPVSEIDTVKALPEVKLSIKKHHYNQFLGEHSYMGTRADEFDNAMRNVLARNTPAALDAFTAEIEHAVSATIPGKLQLQDWKGITPRSAMARMATILSGRVFVGLPLSRDEEWINATVSFTGAVSKAWMVLRFYPHFVRPIVAPFLSQVRSLEAAKALIAHKLGHLLESRRQSGKDATGRSMTTPPNETHSGELLDWFQQQYSHAPSAKELTRDQLLATFASIYNLSNALTYVVFDLAADATVVEELREELLRVVGQEGVAGINKITIMQLRKLDSFVRESQRMSPTSLGKQIALV
jgi:hypothetical protein